MKTVRVIVLAAFALTLTQLCGAQSIDAFFGMSTVEAPHSTQIAGTPYLGGGLYPDIGADLLLWKRLGIGGEVSWKGGAGTYFSPDGFAAPVRPIYYDFNLIFVPISVPKVTPELQVGFGAESLRFYQAQYTCSSFSGCTNYVSSNHLAGHLAAALRFYATPHIFLRPEIHFYAIHNNQEYNVSHSFRVGMSIGYTLGPS